MKWLLFPQQKVRTNCLTLTEKPLNKKENLTVLEHWELYLNLL